MDNKQEEFMRELFADFMAEANEHLNKYIEGLLYIEKNPDSGSKIQVIENIFREIHSTKGAARAVNEVEIERVCQSLESALASLKSGKIDLSVPLLDLFQDTASLLQIILEDLATGRKSAKSDQIMTMVFRLTDAAQGKISGDIVNAGADPPVTNPSLPAIQPPDIPPTVGEKPVRQTDSIRISQEKLRSLMAQAEEFISLKSMFRYFSTELNEFVNINHQFYTQANQKLTNLSAAREPDVGEITQRWFAESSRNVQEKLAVLHKEFSGYFVSAGRMIDELIIETRQTLLTPFSPVLEIFPKMVRDIARQNGKEIAFSYSGGATEIDRRILEEIKDPLMHMVRNCIDHGIESPEERKKTGKTSGGEIKIRVHQSQEREVTIEISDDGKGINLDKVKAAAIREGLITTGELQDMSRDDILQFIFRSGLSTSEMITDISGRGLGLAIVSEKVIKLG